MNTNDIQTIINHNINNIIIKNALNIIFIKKKNFLVSKFFFSNIKIYLFLNSQDA